MAQITARKTSEQPVQPLTMVVPPDLLPPEVLPPLLRGRHKTEGSVSLQCLLTHAYLKSGLCTSDSERS